jgi:hypothetical protein
MDRVSPNQPGIFIKEVLYSNLHRNLEEGRGTVTAGSPTYSPSPLRKILAAISNTITR